MRFGANSFIWESPFATDSHLYLCDRVKEMGFDLLEVAVENPDLIDLDLLRRAAEARELGLVIGGVFGPGRNLSSADEDERHNAAEYLRWCIEAAVKVGSPLVSGPIYSAVGKPRLESEEERRAEWDRAAAGLHHWGSFAAERGIKLAIEPLNRFETDVVNIVDQGLALIDAAGSPAVGLHLDTFHMHLEEKDLAGAIKRGETGFFTSTPVKTTAGSRALAR